MFLSQREQRMSPLLKRSGVEEEESCLGGVLTAAMSSCITPCAVSRLVCLKSR